MTNEHEVDIDTIDENDVEEELLEDIDEEEEAEEVTESEEEVEEVPEAKPQLTREQKLAKAQAMVRRYSPKKVEKVEDKPADTQESLSRDEAKLYARGLSDEQVEKVRKIAQLEDMTTEEAFTSDYYTIWNETQEKEAKKEKAQLRPSRGGKAEVRKSFRTPDLTQEEHKALWNEDK